MTPLELVLGSVVKRVTVSWNGTRHQYGVLVKLPDGRDHRVSTSWSKFERKVCKKAGLKMTTKAAKSAAQVLRGVILQAVEDFKTDPEAAEKSHKAVSRAAVAATRKAERREREQQDRMRTEILTLLIRTRIPLEELTELWEKSVVTDVMTS